MPPRTFLLNLGVLRVNLVHFGTEKSLTIATIYASHFTGDRLYTLCLLRPISLGQAKQLE